MGKLSRRQFNSLITASGAMALLGNPLSSWAQQSPASQPSREIAKGPWEPTWESVSSHKIPDWYSDAKFGISMHWGLYAVPAHQSEWYVKHMYGDPAISQWHAQHFGPQDKFGYKDFMPMFTCANWDPDEWAELFKNAGAKYVMPTVEHHDGFSMWDSAVNRFNAKNFGPKRDVIGELSVAIRKQGLKFGACNHSMEHFDFINPLPGLKTDLYDPDWRDFYSVADRSPEARQKFNRNWLAKNLELIDKYQLDTLWWDNGANGRNLDPLKLQVFAHLYNRSQQWGKEVQMITKGNCSLGGHVEDYERQNRGATTVQPRTFEVHDSPGSRWCYLTDDHYWPSFDIIWRIVENTSKNGNLLFNIGPKPDGTIDNEYRRLLVDAGKWLKVNGEAIHGTRSWTKFGEGKSLNNNPAYTAQDIRFTTKGDTLYVITLDKPEGDIVIPELAADKVQGKVDKVELLGQTDPVDFSQGGDGLHLKPPPSVTGSCAFKITGLILQPVSGQASTNQAP
jgi:alpha-L-fucosidase